MESSAPDSPAGIRIGSVSDPDALFHQPAAAQPVRFKMKVVSQRARHPMVVCQTTRWMSKTAEEEEKPAEVHKELVFALKKREGEGLKDSGTREPFV